MYITNVAGDGPHLSNGAGLEEEGIFETAGMMSAPSEYNMANKEGQGQLQNGMRLDKGILLN